MKKKFLFVALVFFAIMLCLSACEGRKEKAESKISFSYYADDTSLTAVDDQEAFPHAAYQGKTLSLQLLFDYEPISEALYQANRKECEAYKDFSQRYHKENNEAILTGIDTQGYPLFVSEYTPYAFITCTDADLGTVVALAKEIAKNESVQSITIAPFDADGFDPAA